MGSGDRWRLWDGKKGKGIKFPGRKRRERKNEEREDGDGGELELE